MAHHLHTKKAIRQTEKRTRRNRTTKSKMKTAIKHFMVAESADQKFAALKLAHSAIDRAAKKNIIHDKKADRKKSQLSLAYHSFVGSQSA